jgi:hypothetical protein
MIGMVENVTACHGNFSISCCQKQRATGVLLVNKLPGSSLCISHSSVLGLLGELLSSLAKIAQSESLA